MQIEYFSQPYQTKATLDLFLVQAKLDSEDECIRKKQIVKIYKGNN